MTIEYSAAEFSSSTEACDVVIGPNHWKGDLDHYEIHNEGEGVVLDLAFDRGAPSWRPGQGVDFADDGKTTWSGWVVPVPYGTVEGTLTVDGETRSLKGHLLPRPQLVERQPGSGTRSLVLGPGPCR